MPHQLTAGFHEGPIDGHGYHLRVLYASNPKTNVTRPISLVLSKIRLEVDLAVSVFSAGNLANCSNPVHMSYTQPGTRSWVLETYTSA